MQLAKLLARFQRAGFAGPFYRGFRGKARFLFESLAWRTEFVFLATRKSFAKVPRPKPAKFALTHVASFAELEKYRSQLDIEYYPGYLDGWRRPFTWGEQAAIGTMDGRIAAFAWTQRGTPDGYPTYYGRLFEADARILRVGVVPTFRGQGLNSSMMHQLLGHLIEEGFQRVFAESHKYNLPSVRTFLRVGFRIVGAITVLTLPGEKHFVSWMSPDDIGPHLDELGLRANEAPR